MSLTGLPKLHDRHVGRFQGRVGGKIVRRQGCAKPSHEADQKVIGVRLCNRLAEEGVDPVS
jgi:hypothetical protein